MIGYFKKIAKMDNCKGGGGSNGGHDSISSSSGGQNDHQDPPAPGSHRAAPIPEITLISVSPSMSERQSVKSSHSSSAKGSRKAKKKLSQIGSKSCDEAYDEPSDPSSPAVSLQIPTPLGSSKERSSKRRRRRHLLPNSFLNLLPPTSHHRRRSSASTSTDSSVSPAHRRGHSPLPPETQSRSLTPHSLDSSLSTTRPSSTSTSRESSSKLRKSNRVGTLSSSSGRSSRCADQCTPDAANLLHPSLNAPRNVTVVTSPTTICPTIASALWKPLWPPGEHSTLSQMETPQKTICFRSPFLDCLPDPTHSFVHLFDCSFISFG